jgi:hypothetical protein
MYHNQPSQNEYPAINVSGNARAIVGDVYRMCKHPDSERSSPAEIPVPRLKSSQYHIFEEENRSSERFGEVVVSLLEDYKKLRITILRFKSFHRVIQRCASHISIRQGVCEQSLKNFVVLFTRSAQDAQEMLANAAHRRWTHTDFLDCLQDCSSVATEPLWETLALLVSDLEEFDSFTQKCLALCTSNESVSLDSV